MGTNWGRVRPLSPGEWGSVGEVSWYPLVMKAELDPAQDVHGCALRTERAHWEQDRNGLADPPGRTRERVGTPTDLVGEQPGRPSVYPVGATAGRSCGKARRFCGYPRKAAESGVRPSPERPREPCRSGAETARKTRRSPRSGASSPGASSPCGFLRKGSCYDLDVITTAGGTGPRRASSGGRIGAMR